MTQSIRSRTIARKPRHEGARMLALNRNHQNSFAKNTLNLRSTMVRSVALVAICGLVSVPSMLLAQSYDTNYQDSPAAKLPPRAPSILIRDDAPTRPAAAQPLQPRVSSQPFTRQHAQPLTQQSPQPSAPPSSSSLQPKVSSAGFQIPSSPTREDFTNPNTNSMIRATASDESSAFGTFADQSAEPTAEPKPPAAPVRSFGSTSVPVRVAQPAGFMQPQQPDQEITPIVHNDLRSNNANESSGSRVGTTDEFGQHTEPKTDSMTASSRFVDTNPAPPASMPSTSPQRFNPQIFSPAQVQTPQPQEEKSEPLPFTAEPARTIEQPVMEQPAFDNQVAPTSFAQAISNENSGTADLAQTIVDRYSMDNASEPLPGEPMTLKELLQQPLPQQYQPAMVSQYWETWFDWASLQNAIAYQEWLDSVPNASAQGEQGLLDTARSAAENQALAAKIQLGKSQSKLVRFMPTRRSNLAPLPSDSPLVEQYETHYEIYKARNLLPAKLIGIDQMLPQTLTLINHRAETVQKSQAAIKQNLDGYSRKRIPLASVLEAARVWRAAEQDLLASVTSYNRAIADYAFNIKRQPTTPEQTVAMLIGTGSAKSKQQPTTSRTASNAASRNNNRGNRRSRNDSSTAATAASFDQPTNRSNANASTDTQESSTSDTLAANEKLAPTDRPAWGGGNNSRTRPSTAGIGSRSAPSRTASSRSTADARPSLGTSSRDLFGGQSARSGSTAAPSVSSTAFGSSATGSNPATSPSTSRPSSRNFGGRPSFGDRSSIGTNGFAGSNSAASSSRSSAAATTPTAPAKPARKPFPLPKRPSTSSNNFGGF